MIISQTPLRISFAGGGTDLAAYYAHHGGFVVSTAIDKFAYVIVKERFDDMIYLNYMRKEIVESVDEVQHELIREAMRMTGVEAGVEITLLSDIPSAGSGLGSSSSFTVGLLNALHMHMGAQVTAETLAHQACEIEIERLGKPIGKQDQYIAAYGGFRCLRFNPDESVDVSRIDLSPKMVREVDDRLRLYFTGQTRQADKILAEQRQNSNDKATQLTRIKDLALELAEALPRGESERLGTVLHENWELKRQLASGISNDDIERMYAAALAGGAAGGKICGAGGGGFLLVCFPPEAYGSLTKSMHNYREMPFHLERDGSKLIFNWRRDVIK